MSSAELTEWTAYERVYGSIVPHERIDAGFAQVSWLMASLWGKKKRGGEFRVRDFMPTWYQELTESKRQSMSDDELFTVFQGWANANN